MGSPALNRILELETTDERVQQIRMMTEDSGKLIDTIKGPQYDFTTTGIVSVIPLQSRAELITDDVGEILGHMLIVPFDLLYLEA